MWIYSWPGLSSAESVRRRGAVRCELVLHNGSRGYLLFGGYMQFATPRFVDIFCIMRLTECRLICGVGFR